MTYAGLVTMTTNDQGQQRVQEKNADGKLGRSTDAMGAQLAQELDAFGNLAATKDALQNTVTLSVDIRGRKVSMNDPDTGLWKYDYDALGELVWQESPDERAAGTVTTMAYDVLGRMSSRVDPEYTSTWTYDKYADGSACAMGVGKLCQSTTTNGVTKRYSFDAYGRPLNARTDVSGLVYDNTNFLGWRRCNTRFDGRTLGDAW